MTYNERQTLVCQQCGRAATCGYVTRNLTSKCEYLQAVMHGWELGQQDMKEEQMTEDLEVEFNRFLDDVEGVPPIWHYDEQMEWGKDIARHFAQWQREQMMKDAVDGWIEADDNRDMHIWARTEDFRWLPDRITSQIDLGDKVKLIILKQN